MDPEPYQVRYEWDRRIWTVVCCAAAVILIPINLPMPLLPTIALIGGGLLVVLGCLLYRRVALRVDAAGVTLGGAPLRYRTAAPSGALVPQLGVRRRQDETPQLTTHAASGFQLDRRALARAVAHHAPHILVLDADTGREISADG
jgi:hypothetical protein